MSKCIYTIGTTRCICILVLLIFNIEVQAFNFMVEGKYNAYWNRDQIWTNTQTVPFVVRVNNNEWQINITQQNHTIVVYGCNGTNVFSFLADNTHGSKINPGIITQDDYPATADIRITIPWLAFCSANRLARGEDTPAPWEDAKRSPSAYLYKWNIQYYESGMQLPKYIRFETDKDHEKNAGKGKYLFLEGISEKDKMDRSIDFGMLGGGLLGAEYKIFASTNINGNNIPLHCGIVIYDHLNMDASKHTRALMRYELDVSKIEQLDSNIQSLLPIISNRNRCC